MSKVATKDDVKALVGTLTRRLASMLGFAAIVVALIVLSYR